MRPLATWPLALLAGVLPALASLLALALSMHLGLVPACNPFVNGCMSISRAARHELPNHLFRALVLPVAALPALAWVVLARWLRMVAVDVPLPGLATLVPLGLLAAAALVLYGSFPGTEGEIYRWLRRYGTVGYFGFTCLRVLLTGSALQRLPDRQGLAPARRYERTLLTLFAAMVVTGLGNVAAGVWLDGDARDRVENVAEWWGALALTPVFFVVALLWRNCGVTVALAGRAG